MSKITRLACLLGIITQLTDLVAVDWRVVFCRRPCSVRRRADDGLREQSCNCVIKRNAGTAGYLMVSAVSATAAYQLHQLPVERWPMAPIASCLVAGVALGAGLIAAPECACRMRQVEGRMQIVAGSSASYIANTDYSDVP